MRSLVLLASAGDTETVALLVMFGARIDATNRTGHSAVDYAIDSGNDSCVDILLMMMTDRAGASHAAAQLTHGHGGGRGGGGGGGGDGEGDFEGSHQHHGHHVAAPGQDLYRDALGGARERKEEERDQMGQVRDQMEHLAVQMGANGHGERGGRSLAHAHSAPFDHGNDDYGNGGFGGGDGFGQRGAPQQQQQQQHQGEGVGEGEAVRRSRVAANMGRWRTAAFRVGAKKTAAKRRRLLFQVLHETREEEQREYQAQLQRRHDDEQRRLETNETKASTELERLQVRVYESVPTREWYCVHSRSCPQCGDSRIHTGTVCEILS